MSREEPEGRPLEEARRSAASRVRIVRAASEVVSRLGVAGMSVERVCAASGVSRSQVYRCFPAEDALVSAVVDLHVAAVLGRQRSLLLNVASLADLYAWAEDMVELGGARRCESGLLLGSLVTQLADRSDGLRAALDAAFRTWQSYLAAGLHRLQEHGELDGGADPCELAAGIVAALQGGLILAQAVRGAEPLQAALDLALGSLPRAAPPAAGRAPGAAGAPRSRDRGRSLSTGAATNRDP
ncbi:TetR/AcrR family transcriptional regulator [Pseudonocardia dioxanivorans]|nr:TetR family transcriptional regulator C-terminal domain-containing protein [Pseudonocardia dioxanivorans]